MTVLLQNVTAEMNYKHLLKIDKVIDIHVAWCTTFYGTQCTVYDMLTVRVLLHIGVH